MFDFNNAKYLKNVLLVCSIFAVFIIVGRVVNFVQFYFNIDNPLIPRYLIDYFAFPLYFIIPAFIIILIYAIWCLKNNTFNKYIIIGILIFSIVYFLFQSQIHQYLQSFSPYHSSNLE